MLGKNETHSQTLVGGGGGTRSQTKFDRTCKRLLLVAIGEQESSNIYLECLQAGGHQFYWDEILYAYRHLVECQNSR